jgi:beta-RFAP synthase
VAEPKSDRIRIIVQRVLESFPQISPCHIEAIQIAPEHQGLGTGTQLSLAVLQGLLAHADISMSSAADFSTLAGRGRRSGIGVLGFLLGGFLVDGGKAKEDEPLAPLLARFEFPGDWRVVLALPTAGSGVHGVQEVRAFADLEKGDLTGQLAQRVLLELLPALATRDFPGFSEALHQYNRLAGQPFARYQFGCYATPLSAELVDFLRNLGVTGCGQSSWGPGIFALAVDPDHADWIVGKIRSQFPSAQIFATRARNQGASVSQSYAQSQKLCNEPEA